MAQNNAPATQSGYFAAVPPSEKPIYIALLISVLFGLVTVFIPLCPVGVETSAGHSTVINMVGAIGQSVGSDSTRSEAFVPLLLYFVGAAVLAAACMCVMQHLKSSALFLAAAAVILLVFVSLWKSADIPPTDAVVKTFTQTAVPYAVIFCAVGALIAALAALLLSTDELKKLRK